MEDIYQILKQLGIDYKEYRHPAVYTCEEADKYTGSIEAGKSKNLFLRNKKGDRHYLVIIGSAKRTDLKKLEISLNEKNLSFASSERLLKYLGLTAGSVSPFGLINDKEKAVQVVLDKDLVKNKKVGFHPNENTSTLVVSTENFQKFLDYSGNSVIFLDL